MSNYLFLNQEKSAELLVPLTPVDYNLQAQNDRLIYVPLATRDNFGVVKIGEGLTIEHGLVSFDRKELDVKLSTNVGSENAGKFLYVSDTGNIVFVDQVQTITKISDLENDVGYITNEVDDLHHYYDIDAIDVKFEDVMTLSDTQLVSGIKVFTETIGLLNADGTLDRIRHINNNFLIVDQNGTALLDIDEGFKTIKSFGKELAFVEDIPNLSDVPTKVSDLINDTGFITNAVDNLVNYYLKTEQYTKEEINELVSKIPKFDVEVVDDPDNIPEEERSETTIYLVPRTDGELNDYYDEIIWIHNTWERFGSTKINLSNYYTKTDSDKLFLSKTDANSTFAKIIDIPTKVSELENDSGFLDSIPSEYITESELNDKNYATKGELPTRLSQLQNDRGFITAADIPEGGILYDTIGQNTDGAMSQAASTNAFALKNEIPDTSDFITLADVPTDLKDFNEDTTHRTVTDVEKNTWNNKVDKVPGMDLSEVNFTTAYKTKLESIEANAQINTVNSVNGKTGNVVLLASDVGALPSDTEIPTVNNGTLTIQKNGTNIATFSANQSGNATANIIIPTTASDVSALPNSTKYGASLSLSMNTSTYVVTVQLKDQDGNNLGTAQTIDLPLESVVVSGAYNNTTKKVVLTLKDGSTVDFSVADLVSGLVSESSFNELEDRVGTNETSIKTLQTNVDGLQNDLNSEVSAREDAIRSVNLVLDTKVSQVAGYGLSEENFTSVEKEKLASLEATVGGVVALVKDYPSNNKVYYQYCSNQNAKVGDNIFIIYEYRTNTSTYYFKELRGVYGTITAKDPSYYTVSLYSSSTSLVWAELERNYAQTGQNTDGSMTQKAITDAFALKSEVKTKTSELENDSGFITASSVPTKLSELSTDANNQRVSSDEKTTWNNKSNFSGNYNDLTNKPTIPTNTSQLTNNSGFITSSSVPTKTSQLTNDSGFLTSSDLPTIPDTSKMVLTDSPQTISGAKTFTGAIIVPDVTIS